MAHTGGPADPSHGGRPLGCCPIWQVGGARAPGRARGPVAARRRDDGGRCCLGPRDAAVQGGSHERSARARAHRRGPRPRLRRRARRRARP
eukprot:6733110-Prymnesium_polylepis.2